MQQTETVLFLCTGNYYRSRLAEHYFNHLADRHGLGWRAESRGLDPDPYNPGPMSRNTARWLAARGIAVPDPVREPLRVNEGDFAAAALVVAVKEAEHRPMLEWMFPDQLRRVEFWHVHDLDCAPPEEAIPELARLVEELVLRLSGPTPRPRA